MSTTVEMAIANFGCGFNCAQSVVEPFCKKYCADRDSVLKACAGFGHGFRLSEICGAISGAAVVIGLKYGKDSTTNRAEKENCNKKTLEFMNKFQESNPSIICREVLKSSAETHKNGQPLQIQGRSSCENMIISAVNLLEELGY